MIQKFCRTRRDINNACHFGELPLKPAGGKEKFLKRDKTKKTMAIKECRQTRAIVFPGKFL